MYEDTGNYQADDFMLLYDTKILVALAFFNTESSNTHNLQFNLANRRTKVAHFNVENQLNRRGINE